jgi:hypothetical protein
LLDVSQFNHDFNALLDARFPILVSETHEESRFLARVREICNARDMPLFLWSLADGLKRSTESGAVYNTNEFTDALKHVDATPQNGLYVFLDAHPFFDTPLNARLVREIAFEHYRRDRTLLFVSPTLNLPSELARMSARIAMPGISADRVRSLLKEELDRWQRDTRRSLRIDRDILPLLVHQLAGLGEEETQRLIRQAISVDGELNLGDVKRIARFKQDQQASALEMALPDVTLDDVGDLRGLKPGSASDRGCFRTRRSPRGYLCQRAFCCSACRVPAKVWLPRRWPEAGNCPCCGLISLRFTTNTLAKPKRT